MRPIEFPSGFHGGGVPARRFLETRVAMKIKMMALAGVAALALTRPAVASDATGWYLGLGAGWDHMGQVSASFVPNASCVGVCATSKDKADTDDSALVVLSAGYRGSSHVRLEAEVGYDQSWGNDRHDVPGGHVGLNSALINVAYDAPLSDKWAFTIGAGA